MTDLYVIDVSAVVHTAESSKGFSDRTYYNYPVGGIHLLMKYVAIAFSRRDHVVLCFDSPTKKKAVLPGYKGGRSFNANVISQLEVLYSGLSSCGIRCEKFENTEADDVVDWAVKQNLDDYDEIIIIGNDYDLCHSVQAKVRFKAINPSMNSIYRGNFETGIERGVYIPFNMISAYKVFCGCHSDKIPAFHLSNGLSGKKLFDRFVEFFRERDLPDTYECTSGWESVYLFVRESGLFNESEQQEALVRISLVYPDECPEGVVIQPTDPVFVNEKKLAHFLSLYNDYDSLRCLQLQKVYLSEEDKELLRTASRKLTSGEFAADNNVEMHSKIKNTTLTLDAFSKDF